MDHAARPKLFSIAVELTAYCNQKCSYCYNGWRADNGASVDAGSSEQLIARCEKLLDEFDIDHFTLTGGEPFAQASIWPLLDLLRDHGVGAQIISNGGLIDERIAERLAPYDVSYVQITLNGPDPALHEAHTGEGHFDKTLRGIAALQKHGVTVVGCVVVTKKNAPRLGEILELWHSLDVTHIALSRFSPAGYAIEHAAALLPSRNEIMQAFELAVPFGRDRGMTLNCTMPVPPCMLETDDYAPITFGTCPIGTEMQEFALGPDGKLRNCTLHATAIGGVNDILADDVDLRALVNAPEVAGYRSKLPSFCDGCIHAPTCGGGCGAAAEWMLGLADEGKRRLPDPLLWQHIDDDFGTRLENERTSKTRLRVVL